MKHTRNSDNFISILIGSVFVLALPCAVHAGISITLESAINRALAYNRSLLGARDSLLSSQYSLAGSKVDFELTITPSAIAGVSGSDSEDTVENLGFGMALSKRLPWGTNIFVTPATQHGDDFYTSSVNMDFTQPILRGIGREYTLSGVRSAEFAERSVRRSLYLTRVNTVLGTVQSVYDVIRLGEDVRHNQASIDRLRLHLEGMRVKSKAGHTSSIDLYRAELEVRNAQDALVESQEAYGDAVDSLKVLLAFPLDEKIEVDAPLEFSAIDITDAEAIKVAMRNRVEIDQAGDALGEAKRLSRVAGHNTWPQLDVVVHYGRSGTAGDFGPSLNLDEEIWSINLVSSTDVFRKTEKLAYKQSLLQVQGARRSFSLTKDQVVQEVKRERRNLTKATEQI